MKSSKDNQKPNIRPYVRQIYRGNAFCLVAVFVGLLIETGLSLIVSWLLQQIVDLIGGQETGFTLVNLLLISLASLAGLAITCLISYVFKPRLITRGMAQYREFVLERLTQKGIATFSSEGSAIYLSALTNDLPVIEKGYISGILTLMSAIPLFAGALLLMLWYSPLLTLIAIGLSLLPLIASILTGNRMGALEKGVSDQNEQYTATIKDCIGGFSVIKAFRSEAQILRILKNRIIALSGAKCREERLRIVITTMGEMAGVITQMGVFFVAAYLALSGKGITAGTAVIFLQLMNYVLHPIGVIPTCLADRQAAKALVEKIAEALEENVRTEGTREEITLDRGIEICDLSFGYEEDRDVLTDIDCTLKAGKKYALVGTSGSGKSTLLSLLMASHRDYRGKILIDGRDLHTVNSADLYEAVSIIQQSVFVFNATIRDNITMFRPFEEEQIERAIRLSGLSSVIDQKGADFLCGENGNGLSGGEKQRISIARCLLQNARMLLVDEATAALDAATAYQVTSAILGLEDMTAVVVTHTLDESLLGQYDRIFALKNGRIVEEGSFDELIEKKGYFYSLFTVSQ